MTWAPGTALMGVITKTRTAIRTSASSRVRQSLQGTSTRSTAELVRKVAEGLRRAGPKCPAVRHDGLQDRLGWLLKLPYQTRSEPALQCVDVRMVVANPDGQLPGRVQASIQGRLT
jgi:hypothetical protein